ncbi:hypothetical protein BV898_10278 [Hypsibius exemplaris]|uniref:PEHE domain-containing protein n=1 Tax=Hypsibius exemplaris TaxID=2072580 RepID=A0A1W0WK11_HYPEX|nr:hypothetical protein BV898_10278 [Hypsibius exemplaris]
MVASTEPTSWPELENGVEYKFPALLPPPPESPIQRDFILDPDVVMEENPVVRSLSEGEGIFAVPAVPKKTLSPRRTQQPPAGAATTRFRKSPTRKGRPAKSSPAILQLPSKPKTTLVENFSVVEEVPPDEVIPPPLAVEPTDKVSWLSGGESVSTMLYSLAGLLHRRNGEKMENLVQRLGRISTFHVQHSVANGLTGGSSMFHDFLNRESFRPEGKIATALTGPAAADDTRKEVLLTSKTTESKSMQELFGVLSASTTSTASPSGNKEDMKTKTPSQLMEFVKRVESGQRREAFEKQQRPAYLLKLTRHQSADRSGSYISHAQNLHRAIDRTNVLDPGRTDSSSGGESADEAENEMFQQNVPPEHFIPVERRALHRYAKARHAIATRYQFGHRQLARLEYGCQVTGSLLQRLQQKQGIAVFGDGALDDCKTSIRPAFPLHRDSAFPRAWDDRDVVVVSKTSNASAFLRAPTAASTAGQSLHPSANNLLFKKKMKVATPNYGLNYQLDTYEATMWKERLCSGKVIVEGAEEGEDWEEVVGAAEPGKEKELTECAVSSARGCARARPLSAFRKRMIITMDSYPPKRLALEEKRRTCHCYSRSLMPDLMGPVSCAICMGQLSAPQWSDRTALMKTTPRDALSHLDRTYHPHLSQPSNRSLDTVLSGVSFDFDPSKPLHPVKLRLTKREKYLAAVKREGELLDAIKKKEEEIRADHARKLKLTTGKYPAELIGPSKNKKPRPPKARKDDRMTSNKNSARPGRPKVKRPVKIRQNAGVVRKRRHSSVSSDTTVSSEETNRTRSISVGSVENVSITKAASKRGLNRTVSMSKASGGGRKKRESTGFDPTSYVIPYGMAAPSKIEKIQYKEIVVPKFRDLKSDRLLAGRSGAASSTITVASNGGCNSELPDMPSSTMVKIEPASDSSGTLVEPIDTAVTFDEEDLSDSAFILRHVPCEAEERSRFNVPEKNPRRKNVPAKSSGNPDDPPPVIPERHPSTPGRKPGRFYQSKIPKHRRDSRGRMRRASTVVKALPAAVLPLPSPPAQSPPPPLPQQQQQAPPKRPRKTPAEISAMFPLNPRPQRIRRSTFRSSPDATDP